MAIEKVEDTIVGNRQFLIGLIADLKRVFPYKGYKPEEIMASIMYDEGRLAVIGYLERKYK